MNILEAIEYLDCYPVDESFVSISAVEPKLSFKHAADWLLTELPRAAKHMPCFCEVKPAKERFSRKPVRHICFSTGGWSGAESVIRLIERRVDLSYYMLSWRRGGHYVFEVPAAAKKSLSEVRALAWATRRARYGERGHSGAYRCGSSHAA